MGLEISIDVDWGFANQGSSRCFQYGSALYQMTAGPVPGTSPMFFSMWKSTNAGFSWTRLVHRQCQDGFVSQPGVLIGTTLFIWFADHGDAAGVYSLGTFDFTSDTFTKLATSGTATFSATGLSVPPSALIAGTTAALLTVVSNIGTSPDPGNPNVIKLGNYVSNAYADLGTITEVDNSDPTPIMAIQGASGIVHVLYLSTAGGSGLPSALKYFNVSAGVISTPVLVKTAASDRSGSADACVFPIQIGGNIHFSMFDPGTGALLHWAFDDSATPTFATTVIDADPGVPIDPPSGRQISRLSFTGGTLKCFYTNSDVEGIPSTGNGDLYLSTSADQGATWGARSVLLTHLGPVSGDPVGINAPNPVESVNNAAVPNPLFVTYLQNNDTPGPDSGFENTRFDAQPGLTAACALNTAEVGVPYSSFVMILTGIPPFFFFLHAGSMLPPGLTLNNTTGEISGTPTQAGTFPYSVDVDDEDGDRSITIDCSITVTQNTQLVLSFKGIKVYPQS